MVQSRGKDGKVIRLGPIGREGGTMHGNLCN